MSKAKVRGHHEMTDEECPFDQDEKPRPMYSWAIHLRYRKRRATFSYFTSQLSNDPEPVMADVLHCLLSDSRGADEPFEHWCGNFGYDTDSRRAEKTYEAVKANAKKLEQLLGDDFDEFADLDEDDVKTRCAEWT